MRRLNDGHSDWCEVCSFHLHLSKNWWCWASFHMPVAKWMSSLRNVCWDLLPIFWLGCFCCWVWTACVFYRLRTEVLKVRSREPRLGQETPWNCFYNSSFLLTCSQMYIGVFQRLHDMLHHPNYENQLVFYYIRH